MEEIRIAYKVLAGKPEGKKPLGISRRRRKNSIKVGLNKGWGKWIRVFWLM
jgi:hypothetical protein